MKSQQDVGICGRSERSEVLLDVLSVMLTQLASEAVNQSGCKAGLEVGMDFVHQYQQSQNSMVVFWASILGSPSFFIVIVKRAVNITALGRSNY